MSGSILDQDIPRPFDMLCERDCSIPVFNRKLLLDFDLNLLHDPKNPDSTLLETSAPTTSSTSWTSPTSRTTSSTSIPTATSPSTFLLLARLILRFGLIINQKGVQWQRIRQYVIPDCASSNIDRVQTYRLAGCTRVGSILDCHLDRAQCCIHLRRYGGNRAVNDCAIFEFNCHRFVGALHEKSVQTLSAVFC